MKHRLGAGAVICIAFLPHVAGAQTDPARFEVASVRPNELGTQSQLLAFRNGRFTARYSTAKELIRWAYRLTDSQVFGGPAWLNADRFDVLATAPETPHSPRGIIPAPVLTMLRNLLEERFHLKARLETREYPLFALVLARQDGTLGPGMRRRTIPCTLRAVGELGELLGPLPSTTRTQCGGRTGPGMLLSTGATVLDLVFALSRPELVPDVGRIVVDRTGLTGAFDIDLRWTRDSPFTDRSQSAAPTPSVGADPPLFTALQEQLGLKLERTKGPVDVLVIDQIEPPTPN